MVLMLMLAQEFNSDMKVLNTLNIVLHRQGIESGWSSHPMNPDQETEHRWGLQQVCLNLLTCGALQSPLWF